LLPVTRTKYAERIKAENRKRKNARETDLVINFFPSFFNLTSSVASITIIIRPSVPRIVKTGLRSGILKPIGLIIN
jgi:hypothetical protein